MLRATTHKYSIFKHRTSVESCLNMQIEKRKYVYINILTDLVSPWSTSCRSCRITYYIEQNAFNSIVSDYRVVSDL